MHSFTVLGFGLFELFQIAGAAPDLENLELDADMFVITPLIIDFYPVFWVCLLIGTYFSIRRIQLNRVEIAEFRDFKGGVGKYLKSGRREFRLESWVEYEVIQERQRSSWGKKPA